jgi:hypothetical protein
MRIVARLLAKLWSDGRPDPLLQRMRTTIPITYPEVCLKCENGPLKNDVCDCIDADWCSGEREER